MKWLVFDLMFCGYIIVSFFGFYLVGYYHLNDPELNARRNQAIFKETLELYNEMQAIPESETIPKFLDIMYYVTVSFRNLCLLYSDVTTDLRINITECVFTNPCDIWDSLKIVNDTFENSQDRLADLIKVQEAFDTNFSNKSYLNVAEDFFKAMDYENQANMPSKMEDITEPCIEDPDSNDLQSHMKYILSEVMKNAYNISTCLDQAANSDKIDESLKNTTIPLMDQIKHEVNEGNMKRFLEGQYGWHLNKYAIEGGIMSLMDILKDFDTKPTTKEELLSKVDKGVKKYEKSIIYHKIMTCKTMTRTSILKLIVFLCVNNDFMKSVNAEVYLNNCLLAWQTLIWFLFVIFPVVPYGIVFGLQACLVFCIKSVNGCTCRWIDRFSAFQMMKTYKKSFEKKNNRKGRRNRRWR